MKIENTLMLAEYSEEHHGAGREAHCARTGGTKTAAV